MDIKIIVAAHKPYRMPQDDIYMPVHVGRALNDGWQQTELAAWAGDNTGDNISGKNKNYCELTALYWAWKNLKADYLGLAHYRRYFKGETGYDEWSSIATKQYLESELKKVPVLLPSKRNYFIESTYNQYVHAHNKQDLDKTLEIIREKYPEYILAWDTVMKSTSGHRFNMFVARWDILDAYCSWLFDILFELEKRLDISEYSENDQRVFGFVSERLLDIWLITNNVKYTELPIINIEGVNWPKKILNFLKRKFIGK
ncbi:MAG: DUF4422 domain-containing protein [Oscillospiraceae bacterium]|nr:DUF4422 domain-containing protein [Oscillospiraceae bacterium]